MLFGMGTFMNLYRVNLNLLIALDALLLEGSVTNASKKLFITQAAMSNNLQQLRELFKDDLLVREKNHMVLTAYAKELQPKLHQVMQEIQSLVVSGQRFDPANSNRVFKLGISDYLSSMLLPKLLTYLRINAPNVKLSIISVYHISNSEPFEKGHYDLAIGKIAGLKSPIRTELLFKEKMACCLIHRDHPLAKKKKITLNDYLSYQHIAVRADNPNFPPVVEESLAKLGQKRNIQIEIPFILPIFKLLEEKTDLIATVIRSVTSIYPSSKYVIKDLPFHIPEIKFYLAWHQRYDSDLGHQWLRKIIFDIGSNYSD